MMTRSHCIAFGSALLLIIIIVFTTSFLDTQKKIKEKTPTSTQESIAQEKPLPESSYTPFYTSQIPAPEKIVFTKPVQEIKNPALNNTLRMYAIHARAEGFSPNILTVYEGDVVNISFVSDDGSYDFTIPSLGIRLYAEMGKTVSTHFIATTRGTFQFLCDTHCPQSGTIKGSLIVAPK